MRKVWILAAALLFAVSMQAADLTVDEILAKNAEAKGGMAKLRELQSLKMTGKLSIGNGLEAPITLTKKRPEKLRMEFTLQGMTATQAFDGTTGWSIMPFLGKKDAEAAAGDELKAMKEMADFDGPFIDPQKKGYTAELLGSEEVEGTKAYKIKISRDGVDTVYYIDAESFLDIKSVSKRKIQGQEVESESSYGNYQEFGGLLFATSIDIRAKGAPGGQAITIDKIELNPTVADDLFTMPAKKAEATPEPKQ